MMELSPKQQTTSLIQSAKKILLLTHQNPDADAIGSVLGLYLALKKLKKDVEAVCVDPIPSTFTFLPFAPVVKTNLVGNREFIINLDCSRTSVDKLGYKLDDHTLKIVVMPKNGSFKKEDLSLSFGTFKFDLIIVLDTPDLERLGGLYDQNADIFYEIPVINIDHHPTNTYFGRVNLVDLTATSTSEILIAITEALEKDVKIFDEHIATCFLAGITGDTASFQNTNTTPKSLTCAAQLLASGARQQEIIKNLFKTKTISTLRLWGRILDKIKEEPRYRFVYSEVTKQDLKEAGAKEEEISGVIDELLRSAPKADLVLLLSEREKGIAGSLRAIDNSVDCTQIAQSLGGGGHQAAAAFLVVGGSLENVREKVLSKIKEYQNKRLGLA
ncbi:MAG: DHH family phosphoesterase [Candidatus Berkelbacteria bacterium]|nr:DHH family phosphoesterase [Candidatus Berkelbacteria bacterium]